MGCVQATSSRRTLRITVAAWITILILTGGFQIYRDAIPDGIVFFAMALALILGRTPVLGRFNHYSWQPRRTAVLLASLVAGVVLVFTPRHGFWDGVVVAFTGVLVLLVAWPDPPSVEKADAATTESTWTTRLRHSAIAWTVVGIAFCAWELAMYFAGYGQSGRTEYPALSDLLDPVLDNPIGRLVFAAAWLAGGIALARRGRARAKAGEELSTEPTERTSEP